MTSTLPDAKSETNARLKELGGFVRSRRESLSPLDFGFVENRRRRVKGLRREEVAEIAGISTDWYAWIEQGRDLNISANTLDNLSSALRLDAKERAHLFKLAGQSPGSSGVVVDNVEQQAVQQLLDSMQETPAYVLDSLWNITAWNQASVRLFGDFGRFTTEDRNMLRLVFGEPSHQRLFLDISETAMCTLAHFRADSAEITHTAEWQNLVSRLMHESDEFARLWSLNSVSWPNTWVKTLNHPEFGRTVYHSLDLELTQPAKMRLVTYLRQSQ